MKTAILITYDKKDSISEATALCEAANYKITKDSISYQPIKRE